MAGREPAPRLDLRRVLRDTGRALARHHRTLFGLIAVSTMLGVSVPVLTAALAGPNVAMALHVAASFAMAGFAWALVVEKVAGGHGQRPLAPGSRPERRAVRTLRGLGAMGLTLLVATPATLLLVLPGLWVMTAWFVAVPAAVTGRLGPMAAAERSYRLTLGQRWRVLALYLGMLGLLWLVDMAADLWTVRGLTLSITFFHGSGLLREAELGGLRGLPGYALRVLLLTSFAILSMVLVTVTWLHLHRLARPHAAHGLTGPGRSPSDPGGSRVRELD
ncbi:hypothetical protein [Geminicoccus flavidas]|uniref:hypothetical protein n=1 Tax=Geminicoccus flavidas TaxID=2506407 RepID=UPI00135CF178|nr:hypothetical protein [Geminicoccus flavidas]